MIKNHTSARYQGFALLLGAISLVAVACSDDDDDAPDNTAGNGGSTAGKPNGGSSGKGGSAQAGKGGGGTNTGGKGGTPSGGNTMGGESMGGDPTGGSGEGPGPIGGEGGMGGVGGVGAGGETMGGEGGSGGEAPIVFDTLENADFNLWAAGGIEYGTGWANTGDSDAAKFKWHDDAAKGVINQWRATAYKVTSWQTVSPIANGTYELKVDVNRGPTAAESWTWNEHYILAKGCKAGEPDQQYSQVTTAAGDAGFTTITLANIVVTSGSCTIGVYADGPDGAWANVDNFVFTKVD